MEEECKGSQMDTQIESTIGMKAAVCKASCSAGAVYFCRNSTSSMGRETKQ